MSQSEPSDSQPATRPDDDRSTPWPAAAAAAQASSASPIAVRLLAQAPAGADRGLSRIVAAIQAPDPAAPTIWRVTLTEKPGWRARLGLGTLPLAVTLPPGCPLPVQVGDTVLLRVLQTVTGIHPRTGAEVRVNGRTVLVEGDDDFLRDLGDLQITQGPCTDPGSARDRMAPRQRGLVRIQTQGHVGYSDHRRNLRALDTGRERLIFIGSWTGYGPGLLPPDASPQIWVALVRLPLPPQRREGSG